MRTRLAFLLVLTVPLALPATDPGSANYRLVGGSPASVAGNGNSPAHLLQLSGGSGQPTGISASPGHSVVAGSASNQLPTDILLRTNFE